MWLSLGGPFTRIVFLKPQATSAAEEETRTPKPSLHSSLSVLPSTAPPGGLTLGPHRRPPPTPLLSPPATLTGCRDLEPCPSSDPLFWLLPQLLPEFPVANAFMSSRFLAKNYLFGESVPGHCSFLLSQHFLSSACALFSSSCPLLFSLIDHVSCSLISFSIFPTPGGRPGACLFDPSHGPEAVTTSGTRCPPINKYL